MASLAASLTLNLLAAPPAQAGYYGGVTYAGGSNSTNGAPPVKDFPMSAGAWGAFVQASYGYSGTASISGSGSCGGQPIPPSTSPTPITATFTWQHGTGQNDQNDPPPQVVLLEETCDTGWSCSQSSAQPGFSIGGSYSNPLGGTVTGDNIVKGDQSGVRYSVQGGSTLSTSVSPSASFSGSGGPPAMGTQSASAHVSYALMVVAPVTISLGGTTPDSSGNQNILVGQQCTGTVNGIPAALQPYATYKWSVSGTTFQDWEPTTPAFPKASPPTLANPQASYLLGGSGPLNIATPQWYWNDPNNITETVSCTVTVTPPAGQGHTFTITAKQTVAVVLPAWQAAGRPGYMQVNALGNNGLSLWAGATAANRAAGQGAGMLWQATVTTPPIPAFGTGSLELIQIVTISNSYTTLTTPVQSYSDPLNGVKGLDSTYPYGNHTYAESSGSSYIDSDSPGIPLTGEGATGTAVAASATFSSSYIDYLMYRPPGSTTQTQWIALAAFTWSTNGGAAIPTTKNWADYATQHGGSDAGSPGTINPSVTTPFSGVMGPAFYPSWTTIDVEKHYPTQ